MPSTQDLVSAARLVEDPSATGILQGPHETTGLGGWWALDIAAPAGSDVLAPEPGEIVKLSGHDPSEGIVGAGGIFGYNVYERGVSGRTYFLTHLNDYSVTVGQHVHAQQVIGHEGDFPDHDPSFNHVHWAIQGSDVEGALLADAAAVGGQPPPAGSGVGAGAGSGSGGSTGGAGGTGVGGGTGGGGGSTTSNGGGSSGGGGGVGGVASAACDILECKLCDAIPLPSIVKRADPLCIACNACRDAVSVGSGHLPNPIGSGLDAIKFLFSLRGIELLAGLALILVGISAASKAMGGPTIAAVVPG